MAGHGNGRVRRFTSRVFVKDMMVDFTVSMLVLAGLALVAFGVWAVFPPAVYVMAGLLILRVAVQQDEGRE